MTRTLLRTLTTVTAGAIGAARHPIASGSYVFGVAKGLVGAVVGGERPAEEEAWATEPPATATAPPVEPSPTPVPSPGPEPTPQPAPPLPPDPMPDPAVPPPPGTPGAEPAEHEPHATSRESAHGGPSSDADVDRWQEQVEEPDLDVETPVGTTGADVATNPDTTDHDLQQPGTEPLMDPATTKAVRSEAEVLEKAADPEKG